MIENRGLLPLLVNLDRKACVAELLGNTHLDGPSPHISFEEDILLVTLASEAFVKKGHNPAQFLANAFYSHATPLLHEPQI